MLVCLHVFTRPAIASPFSACGGRTSVWSGNRFAEQARLRFRSIAGRSVFQTMPVPKFKIRFGADHYIRISGKRYAMEYAPDTFNCRAVLRCSSLQYSGRSDFTATEIEQFITSLQGIVANLKGQCSLTPKRGGSFGVEVAVANTGTIVTTVTFTTLTWRPI